MSDMKTIKNFGVLSVGKMLGVLYVVLGLIIGAIYGGIGLLMLMLGGEGAASGIMFISMAIFMPIVYGIMGFVFGLLMAWLYNVLAGKIGGIQVEVQ